MHAAVTLIAYSPAYLPPIPPGCTRFPLTLQNGADLNAETLFYIYMIYAVSLEQCTAMPFELTCTKLPYLFNLKILRLILEKK